MASIYFVFMRLSDKVNQRTLFAWSAVIQVVGMSLLAIFPLGFVLGMPFPLGVLAIAAGELHTLALRSDGSVVAWGYNGSGQLGDLHHELESLQHAMSDRLGAAGSWTCSTSNRSRASVSRTARAQMGSSVKRVRDQSHDAPLEVDGRLDEADGLGNAQARAVEQQRILRVFEHAAVT